MKRGRLAPLFLNAAGRVGIAGVALAAVASAAFLASAALTFAPGVTFAQDAAASLLPATLESAAGAAFRSVPDLDAGYRFLYEQKFPEARERFSGWSARNPADPFGHISLAASFLFEEFYRQGIMTSDYFLDDKRFLRGIDGEPDDARMSAFHDAIARAESAAAKLLKKDPSDADALFALTLAEGMHSNASSLLEKKQFEALRQIKQADRYAKQLLSVRPDASDAWMALGSANYIIGSLSGTARFFLWFGGVHGDRVLGMEQLEKTAAGGRYLQPYAKILLALAARREGQEELARRLLLELTREFPASPLFAAEYARVEERPIPAATK
jgi:hypothetical protein